MANGPSSILQFLQACQFGSGGAQDTTPGVFFRGAGSNSSRTVREMSDTAGGPESSPSVGLGLASLLILWSG